jgi:hypothetical protein
VVIDKYARHFRRFSVSLVYNDEKKHSGKCLDSLPGQTYSDFDLIICNDVLWDDSANPPRQHDIRMRVYASVQNYAESAAAERHR